MLKARYLNTTSDQDQNGLMIIPDATASNLTVENVNFPIMGYVSEDGRASHFAIIGYAANGEDLILKWNDPGHPDEIIYGLLDGLTVGDEFDRDGYGRRTWTYEISQLDE